MSAIYEGKTRRRVLALMASRIAGAPYYYRWVDSPDEGADFAYAMAKAILLRAEQDGEGDPS